MRKDEARNGQAGDRDGQATALQRQGVPQQGLAQAVPASLGPAPTLRDVLRPRNLEQALHLARLVSSSRNLMPASMRDDPMLVVGLMEFGERFGMTLIESVQNIAVINGKFTMYGDRLLAVVNATGLVEDMEETWEYDAQGQATLGRCRIKRKGRPTAVERTFSIKEAEQARLLNHPKKDVWRQYPKRMLQMRARGLVLRDLFPEVLQGMIPREEAEDIVLDARTGLEAERPARKATVDAPSHPASPEPTSMEPGLAEDTVSLDRVLDLIGRATTQEQLDFVVPMARELGGDAAGRARAAFAARREDIRRTADGTSPSDEELFGGPAAQDGEEPLRKTGSEN